jgi:hypothetical protein
MARRILRDDLPDPAELDREIAGIQRRLETAPDAEPLRRRLASLQARLATPRLVSSARLANLAAKLRHAAATAWLDRIDACLTDQISQRLTHALDVDAIPGELARPKHLQTLAGVLELSPGVRKLAFQMLRRRCGPAPWRLDDEPGNQAFLTRLRAKGIDPTPWLGAARQMIAASNGQTLRLALEDDPLEIFRMGAYFSTCLSPGDSNFFSAVVNAAEVNKRVLFARDAKGRVVGRCLLALTDTGGMLTFSAYCHESGLEFDKLAGRFADDLAARMGTIVVTSGRVPRLVAHDWYDDGACELSQAMAFLAAGSAFREQLKTISVEDFAPALKRAIATAQCTGNRSSDNEGHDAAGGWAWLPRAALAAIVELPELDSRPELILALLPAIEAWGDLSEATLLRVARLAHRAGERRFSQPVLERHAPKHLVREYYREQRLDFSTLEFLAETSPTAALRVLRQTRPRGVRRDEDEECDHRRRLLALAHERLCRPRRAARLRAK